MAGKLEVIIGEGTDAAERQRKLEAHFLRLLEGLVAVRDRGGWPRARDVAEMVRCCRDLGRDWYQTCAELALPIEWFYERGYRATRPPQKPLPAVQILGPEELGFTVKWTRYRSQNRSLRMRNSIAISRVGRDLVVARFAGTGELLGLAIAPALIRHRKWEWIGKLVTLAYNQATEALEKKWGPAPTLHDLRMEALMPDLPLG